MEATTAVYEGTDSRNLTQPTAGFVLVCRLLDVFG